MAENVARQAIWPNDTNILVRIVILYVGQGSSAVVFMANGDSSPFNPTTGLPQGWSQASSGLYSISQSGRIGVYLVLSTRSRGEVISAGSY